MSDALAPRAGMFAVLRARPGYRRLWFAGLISYCGDWFTFLALVRMVRAEADSHVAVGLLMVAQQAPNFFLGSIAGSVADRIPRRTVMIACDLIRAAGALAFLLAAALGLHGYGFVAWTLPLVALQHSLTTFFRPASSASVPHLVAPNELGAAGALDGLSWSLGLVAGSFLGGLAVDHLGVTACFVLDAATFLASAALLRSIALPRTAAAPRDGKRPGFADLGELFAELRRTPRLALAVLAKCAWGVGIAQLYLLTELGERVIGGAASTGVGLLYAARGLGTAIGPAFARRVIGESERALQATIGVGFAAAAIFYGLFGLGLPLPFALVCVALAHAGGSMIWIGATVLVQSTAPDRVRGRAFALEMALHTLTASASPIVASSLVDAGHEPLRVVRGFAIATALAGALWVVAAWRFGRPPRRA